VVLIVSLTLVCVGVVALTASLLVWPTTVARPGRADAVVVFGGDGPRRAEGIRLVSAGVAPTLAISVGSRYDACYHLHERFDLLCFEPTPLSTQGEARWLGAEARARGWRHVVVVVSVPQVTRARLRVERCYRGGLQVVAVHLGVASTIINVVYEWGALIKALTLQRSC